MDALSTVFLLVIAYLVWVNISSSRRWQKILQEHRDLTVEAADAYRTNEKRYQNRIDELHQILNQYMATHLDVAYAPTAAEPEEPEPEPAPLPPGVEEMISGFDGYEAQAELRNDARNLLAAHPDMTEEQLLNGLFESSNV